MNQYGSRKAGESTYEKRILLALQDNPEITRDELAMIASVDKKTLSEYLSKMKKKGMLTRVSYYLPATQEFKLERIG